MLHDTVLVVIGSQCCYFMGSVWRSADDASLLSLTSTPIPRAHDHSPHELCRATPDRPANVFVLPRVSQEAGVPPSWGLVPPGGKDTLREEHAVFIVEQHFGWEGQIKVVGVLQQFFAGTDRSQVVSSLCYQMRKAFPSASLCGRLVAHVQPFFSFSFCCLALMCRCLSEC